MYCVYIVNIVYIIWVLCIMYQRRQWHPLQYSCLENPMDGRAWYAAVHGVAKSRTRLSDFTLTFHFHALEKETATHSSVLAWRIPGMAEPGGLPSMGSHRVGHNWSNLAAAAVYDFGQVFNLSLSQSSHLQNGIIVVLPHSITIKTECANTGKALGIHSCSVMSDSLRPHGL